GGFTPFLAAAATNVAPREFTKGFPAPVAAFEDRLLCARAESRWCSLKPGSWSGLRALTITVEDPTPPGAWIGGDLVAGGWRRGVQPVVLTGADGGAGVRFSETRLDGARVGFTEYPCAKASIGGEWRATRMQPCSTSVATTHYLSTASFSDGPHAVAHCATDFAANTACDAPRTVLIDNNPPAHPRAVVLAGGETWRRVNDFDLGWENPGQGPASPIGGASWRLSGSAGFDTGIRFAPGRDRRSLANLSVPAAGSYALQLWLRDEAGNEAPASAVTVPLRFDDVRPDVAFSLDSGEAQLRAEVSDDHSGPASGQLLYRRVDAASWTELPTKLAPGAAPGSAHLVAPMPELGFGTFVFRADASDAAGNTASSTLRADGTQMAIRRVPPPQVPRAKSRLFARLRGGFGTAEAMTVRFGAPALLSGRLTRADGAGVGDRQLRVVSRPSRGALAPVAVETVRTGEQGRFQLRLPAGPSRRVTVGFAGDASLEPARRPGLELRVRSGVTLRARPLSLRTGEVVRLSGRVKTRGAPLPRRGKLVAIQYLEEATRRWRPVLVTRSDHDGRFRARYRFRYVSGRARIRLRATALAEERWPYVPGSSPPVRVRVEG
ncbi:MAG TPA: carboxypeptidase-like regulatory domain-containing protein, partial [Solirubrobacterales bacterium]|nr:carboxypeptidase-like regulatory domain-containing protein [Solirubrobacterales bacterium]